MEVCAAGAGMRWALCFWADRAVGAVFRRDGCVGKRFNNYKRESWRRLIGPSITRRGDAVMAQCRQKGQRLCGRSSTCSTARSSASNARWTQRAGATPRPGRPGRLRRAVVGARLASRRHRSSSTMLAGHESKAVTPPDRQRRDLPSCSSCRATRRSRSDRAGLARAHDTAAHKVGRTRTPDRPGAFDHRAPQRL